MTVLEFRNLIKGTSNFNWFNSVTFTLEYPLIKQNLNFEGFPSLFSFAFQQSKGWSEVDIKKNNFLNQSVRHFKELQSLLINFVNSYNHIEDSTSLSSYLKILQKQISNSTRQYVFTFESAEAGFLLDLLHNQPQYFDAASNYLSGIINLNNDINSFQGYLLAYEFTSKGNSDIVERRHKEKASITRLTNEFKNSLPQLEKELVDHLKSTEDLFQEHVQSIEQFKVDKEKTYSDWFITTKGNHEKFTKDSDATIKELEEVYKEKLKLEEPAKYWSERANKLRNQGWKILWVLVGLILIICFSLGKLLWNAPEEIYNSFFEGDKSAAIRWSIIYITFISFMAFCIKALSKVMFSSFHLARDCEERYTLTYFYLSLLKDSKIDKEEKQLIMQSLFSRAETGLLKDDSSPTMPNDIAGKLFQK